MAELCLPLMVFIVSQKHLWQANRIRRSSARQSERIASEELVSLKKAFPATNNNYSFALFLEIQRLMDNKCIKESDPETATPAQTQILDVMRMGYLEAIKNFYRTVPQPGMPSIQSNEEKRVLLTNLLYRLGWLTLLRRTAQMIRAGIVRAVQCIRLTRHFSLGCHGACQGSMVMVLN